MIARRAVLIGAALLVGRRAMAQAVIFQTTSITIVARSGRYPFLLQVADTQKKVELGLRFQNSIPPDGGMLFSAGSRPVIMTIITQGLMLTTDIAFIGPAGSVVELHRNVRPNGPDVVSTMLVSAAIQLHSGTIDRIGMSFGDRIIGMAGQGI